MLLVTDVLSRSYRALIRSNTVCLASPAVRKHLISRSIAAMKNVVQ